MNTHASLQADPSSSEPQLDPAIAGPPVPAHDVPAEAAPAVPQSLPDAGDVAGGDVLTAGEERRKVCNSLCARSTHPICKLQAACITTSPGHAVKAGRQAAVCY